MSRRVAYTLTIAGGLFIGAAHGATMFAGIALAIAGLLAIGDLEEKARAEKTDAQLD